MSELDNFEYTYEPPDKPRPVVHEDYIEQEIIIPQGNTVCLQARNIRKEKTGVHATIGVMCDGESMAWDTFNITRDKERTSLTNSAIKLFPNGSGKDYKDALKRDLDNFTQELLDLRLEADMGVSLHGSENVVKPVYTLYPFVVEGGGTIVFGPPGKGKSYIAMLVACSVDSGINTLWNVKQSRVLYINLERHAKSMQNRLTVVNKALGLHPSRPLLFINARGKALLDIADAIKKTVKRDHVDMIILDSISRGGLGDLNENGAANRIIDVLNQSVTTWYAIAHTPRNDSSHVYGSVHFEAGADVMVQTITQQKPDVLGIGLKVTKANDIGKAPMQSYAIEFNDNNLSCARLADPQEFAEITADEDLTPYERIVKHLKENGEATSTEIAEATDVQRTYVSRLLNNSKDFVKSRKDGKHQFYGLVSGREK